MNGAFDLSAWVASFFGSSKKKMSYVSYLHPDLITFSIKYHVHMHMQHGPNCVMDVATNLLLPAIDHLRLPQMYALRSRDSASIF